MLYRQALARRFLLSDIAVIQGAVDAYRRHKAGLSGGAGGVGGGGEPPTEGVCEPKGAAVSKKVLRQRRGGPLVIG